MKLRRYQELATATDVGHFTTTLLQFANQLDFGLVNAVLVVDRPGAKPVFTTVGNTPQEFLELAGNESSSKRDPVLRALKTAHTPVIYDQRTYVSAGAADLWEEQARFGYKNGICVALHLPEHKHFLLGVDRDQALPRSEDRLTRLVADLQLLAVHAQDAATRLLVERPADDKPVPRLTARELEILKWTMEGKSAWTVAQLLRVSEHTVNFHVRNILQKLDVSSKHHAVLKALSIGLL